MSGSWCLVEEWFGGSDLHLQKTGEEDEWHIALDFLLCGWRETERKEREWLGSYERVCYEI